jgi:acetyl esterase/lipase
MKLTSTAGAITLAARPDGPASQLSAADRVRLDRLNRVWNADIVGHRAETLEIYAPFIRRADNSAIAVFPDLAYGADARQKLDVFVPHGANRRRVLVFVHGGAFTRGNKSSGGFYDNVAYWFAHQGFVAVNVEYRLAPAAQFPAGADDVGRAVEWVAENIAAYGGDPGDIVLMGHSAGGCHVASYLLDRLAWNAPHAAVSAAILVSARLRLECLPDNPNAANVAAYCGNDPVTLERCSPVNHVGHCRWPVFIAIAEYENRHLDAYGLEFAARLASVQGQAPRVVQASGHNHNSIISHFNSGEDWLGRQMIAFLAATGECMQ